MKTECSDSKKEQRDRTKQKSFGGPATRTNLSVLPVFPGMYGAIQKQSNVEAKLKSKLKTKFKAKF